MTSDHEAGMLVAVEQVRRSTSHPTEAAPFL